MRELITPAGPSRGVIRSKGWSRGGNAAVWWGILRLVAGLASGLFQWAGSQAGKCCGRDLTHADARRLESEFQGWFGIILGFSGMLDRYYYHAVI